MYNVFSPQIIFSSGHQMWQVENSLQTEVYYAGRTLEPNGGFSSAPGLIRGY